MPSPIAHLSVGYAVYRINKRALPEDRRRFWILPVQLGIIFVLSMIPDLDVLLAIVFRDLEKYHNNISHSLFLGPLVAFACAGLLYWLYRSGFGIWFLICLLLYELHVVMDFFSAERGVMLLWPFSQARFVPPVKLFYGLQWGFGWFSIWHLWTIFTESLFSLVVIFAVHFFDKRRTQEPKTLS